MYRQTPPPLFIFIMNRNVLVAKVSGQKSWYQRTEDECKTFCVHQYKPRVETRKTVSFCYMISRRRPMFLLFYICITISKNYISSFPNRISTDGKMSKSLDKHLFSLYTRVSSTFKWLEMLFSFCCQVYLPFSLFHLIFLNILCTTLFLFLTIFAMDY